MFNDLLPIRTVLKKYTIYMEKVLIKFSYTLGAHKRS